jgi:predicted ArsR family transcriptional regulator
LVARVLAIKEADARYHAALLEDAGLLRSIPVKTGRRGRPPLRYFITQSGRDALVAQSTAGATTPALPTASVAAEQGADLQVGVVLVAEFPAPAIAALDQAEGLELLADLMTQLKAAPLRRDTYRLFRTRTATRG